MIMNLIHRKINIISWWNIQNHLSISISFIKLKKNHQISEIQFGIGPQLLTVNSYFNWEHASALFAIPSLHAVRSFTARKKVNKNEHVQEKCCLDLELLID